MNGAHWHLILNHAPVMAVLIGILLLAGGISTKSRPVVNAALLVLVFAALMTIPVYLTGEPAEDVVENLGVDHDLIREHEKAAQWALWGVSLLGLLALVSLYQHVKRRSNSGLFQLITLLLGLFVLTILYRVGNLGGQIRHPEISTPTTEITPGNSLKLKDDD